MKFYTIDIWEHFVSLKTLVWLASFSENSWEHYILRKPLLRKVRFYALVLPGLFVTKNVFFYSKKRRRRKKKLFSQWFSKKTLKIRVFSRFFIEKPVILLHLQHFQLISLKTCRFCTRSFDSHTSIFVCKHNFHEWGPWACGTLLLDCILVLCFGGISGQTPHGLWQLLQPEAGVCKAH